MSKYAKNVCKESRKGLKKNLKGKNNFPKMSPFAVLNTYIIQEEICGYG
jgi:hypothetical protein